MSFERAILVVGLAVVLGIAAFGSVAFAASSGGGPASQPMHYHQMRYHAGPGGDGHDPANCPNMGGDGGSNSTTPGSDASSQL